MRISLAASLLTMALSPAAFSCSCVHGEGCAGLGSKAYPVFLGTVLQVTDLPRSNDVTFLSSRKARIRVDEAFGGLADRNEVDILTGSGGGDCGVAFQAGDVYLVAASVGEDGLIYASICSSTHKVQGDDSTVRVLRQQRDGQKVPTLIGRIVQTDRNFEGSIGTLDQRPLTNTLVRVKGDGKIYESWSDAGGRFTFYDLPSGRYEFAPDLPAGTTLSWFIGSDRPLGAFEVKAGTCQERNVEAYASGSIQGRVLDESNKLVSVAQVFVLPADQELPFEGRNRYWEFQQQDKEGFFKFVHLPPGRYLLVVNPEDASRPDFPYPRTFYPGVHDRESAAVITIRAGEKIKDSDIQLKQQFTPRQLRVRVTWSDGHLINNFVFVQAKGTNHPEARSDSRQPNLKESVIDLSILPDEAYDVIAELTCRYATANSVGPGAHLRSNPVHVAPDDQRTDLILTIPASSCPEVAGKTPVTHK
jgi:hypothetical protein